MRDLSKYQKIGIVTEEMANAIKFKNIGDVYASPGIIKHVRKHLCQFSKKEKEDIYKTMRSICDNPDYIGASPDKIGNSIELIKKFDNNILLAIEVDKYDNYNYVSSIYVVSQGKVNNRLNSSRLVRFTDISDVKNEVALEKDIKLKEIEKSEIETNKLNSN